MTLARWTYTKQEWKAFLRSGPKQNNLFYHVARFFVSKTIRTAPVVRITPEQVWIGNDQQDFSNAKHELKQIDLHGEGAVNILTITYERNGSNREIKIPVPRGKLREAIEVQERLTPKR